MPTTTTGKRKRAGPSGGAPASKQPRVQHTVHFKFERFWTMAPACGDRSINPAHKFGPCIYIMYNRNNQHAYVGYAKNAKHRWQSRTEVFHLIGLDQGYAGAIYCTGCLPRLLNQNGVEIAPVAGDHLKGKQNAEHLLLRALMEGVASARRRLMITNTQLTGDAFGGSIGGKRVTRLKVDFPRQFRGLTPCDADLPQSL